MISKIELINYLKVYQYFVQHKSEYNTHPAIYETAGHFGITRQEASKAYDWLLENGYLKVVRHGDKAEVLLCR